MNDMTIKMKKPVNISLCPFDSEDMLNKGKPFKSSAFFPVLLVYNIHLIYPTLLRSDV
jgi:hypothetical protein